MEALEDPKTLSTPPLDRFGGPVGIVRRFGSPEEFRKAIAEIERALYA